MRLRRWFGSGAAICFALLLFATPARAQTLTVEVGRVRTQGEVYEKTDSAVREFARRAALLTSAQRARLGNRSVFSLPLRVELTSGGRKLATPKRQAGDLVPTFDTTGSRVFPTAYREHLQAVFASARPAMNAVFGMPAVGGIVRVRNYDADIQDRFAVAGGYYIPNGPDGPEIRFPVYNSPVSAAVNYIHTLLLAYRGSASFGMQAWDEGMARAATLRVARQSGSVPGSPSPDELENSLATYDVGPVYDWLNQPALAGPKFIPNNLLNLPLPIGGSIGGLYLLRYEMAGSAWQKALVEYPGLLSELNLKLYQSPALFATEAGALAQGQAAIDRIRGAGSTIEGLGFEPWATRQFILDPNLTPGLKTLVEPLPLPPTNVSDFAVFDIWLHAFRTQANGDETLLDGTSYPLYWRPDFQRFFTSAQDDVAPVGGGFGSVTPNFPSETFSGKPYLVTVDLPFQSAVARAYLPAGAVQAGVTAPESNFYGTLVGFPAGTYKVGVEWPGGSASADVFNQAFGTQITTPSYAQAQSLLVRVRQVASGGETVVATRRVNKGPGSIALDLRADTADFVYSLGLAARLGTFAAPSTPWRHNFADVLDSTAAQTLAARWDPILGRYRFYPEFGGALPGWGAFIRPPVAKTVQIAGRTSPRTPLAVALEPGWNLVGSPLTSDVPTAQVGVTKTTERVFTYDEAKGTLLGAVFFQFEPDPGNPEEGSLVPATSFEMGKAYFVRALQADGAVLLFQPAGSAMTPARAPASDFAGFGLWRGEWRKLVRVVSGSGAWCQVEVGQRPGAKPGFEPALDAEAPPSFGGIAMSVRNQRSLYRDVRAFGTAETYTIDVSGLKAGQRYTLRVEPLIGRQTTVLYDLETRTSRPISVAGLYYFRANSSTRRFEIRAGGWL